MTTGPNYSSQNGTGRRKLALFAALGFLVIAAFQLLLLLGAPFGVAAFGGKKPGKLPAGLRAISAVAAVAWLFAGAIVLARGGLAVPKVSEVLARRGTLVLAAVLALSTLMNAASSSRWERFGWAPLVLLLGACCTSLSLKPGMPDETHR